MATAPVGVDVGVAVAVAVAVDVGVAVLVGVEPPVAVVETREQAGSQPFG